jgi:hypothetical protein
VRTKRTDSSRGTLNDSRRHLKLILNSSANAISKRHPAFYFDWTNLEVTKVSQLGKNKSMIHLSNKIQTRFNRSFLWVTYLFNCFSADLEQFANFLELTSLLRVACYAWACKFTSLKSGSIDFGSPKQHIPAEILAQIEPYALPHAAESNDVVSIEVFRAGLRSD